MNVLTFALGLITLGLVKADVSHLRQNSYQQRSSGSVSAFNGQIVQQSFNGDAAQSNDQTFNRAGNEPNSKSRYWWMNTETLPFTKTHNNEPNVVPDLGCNRCMSRKLNIRQNIPQHATQQKPYNQNFYINVKDNPSSPLASFNDFQTAPVSGSPREVNNFFAQQMFESGRIQQSSSCADSNSGCVAPKFCFNGFIDQSAEYKAVRSVSIVFCIFMAQHFATGFPSNVTMIAVQKEMRNIKFDSCQTMVISCISNRARKQSPYS
jgi:hypothetical protein